MGTMGTPEIGPSRGGLGIDSSMQSSGAGEQAVPSASLALGALFRTAASWDGLGGGLVLGRAAASILGGGTRGVGRELMERGSSPVDASLGWNERGRTESGRRICPIGGARCDTEDVAGVRT